MLVNNDLDYMISNESRIFQGNIINNLGMKYRIIRWKRGYNL